MILREPTFKVVRAISDQYKAGYFVLASPLVFLWESKQCVITIETHTKTNFASIPFGLRNLYPVNGRHRLPSVVHDALYGAGGIITTQTIVSSSGSFIQTLAPVTIRYTRREADEIFKALMMCERVSNIKATTMFWGVRLFGFAHWSKK